MKLACVARCLLCAAVFLCFSIKPALPALVLPTDVGDARLASEILWQAYRRLPAEKRPRIVLVLGGGGARGLAHIGVLRALEQERIPIDEIIGVSVGALIGSLYAAGLPLDQIKQMAARVGWNELTDYSRFNVLRLLFGTSLLSTEKMELYLNRYIGGKTFSELRIPFACIATDLRTGERIVFQDGPVAPAARASATIPGIFTPVSYRQRLLVDGGVVDNLPTDLAVNGTSGIYVIGVLPKAGSLSGDYATTFGAMTRSLEIQKNSIVDVQKKAAHFLIEPDVGGVSIADLSKSRECIDAGLVETRRQALALKKSILAAWKSGGL